ncbi:chaperonin 10-like protein, partial [Ilyonectria sp. MPI-CAGE-AT-0026]
QFRPKQFEEDDVDIALEACAVCGSDVHKTPGGCGPCSLLLCVGHEVVGRVVRKGAEVSTVGIGDRVGIGGQVLACV